MKLVLPDPDDPIMRLMERPLDQAGNNEGNRHAVGSPNLGWPVIGLEITPHRLILEVCLVRLALPDQIIIVQPRGRR